MKLKALQIHGFKSFADSTEIEFHDGITSIVGPNGCGKSNISDAIRWVLGEQKPTAIRGAKMEEAIFQGSVNRRPVNRASVSVVVSNEDGALPIPFEEVELGRTVYRDGGSDYSINRSNCRLRDVLDLCRDTGLGANAYSIIENRMIDAILSDRAEERRGLFEEAAGIGKYKDRRKAALRRLERAEMDLQRLDDVIGEVESKVRGLARQKGKAQRFQTLRDRRLAVEVSVVRHQLDTLEGRREEVERELVGDLELGEGYLADLRSSETQLETLRLRQVEVDQVRSEAAKEVDRIRQELVRWERDLAVAEEKVIYARRRISQIAQEKEEIRTRKEGMEAEEGSLREAESDLASGIRALGEEHATRSEAVRKAREDLDEAREDLSAVEARQRELLRRLAHLEGEANSAEAQGEELGRHLDRIRKEMEEASDSLSDVEAQGDLFVGLLDRLRGEVDEGKEALERAKQGAQEARTGLENARTTENKGWEEVAALEARAEALEGMDRSQEGLEPTVKAALDLEDPGVLGTLGDALTGDPEVISAVEAFLGPALQGLVVEDQAAVERLGGWFEKKRGKRGGLVLYPLDRAPVPAKKNEGNLLDSLVLSGPGAPWAHNLLASVSLTTDSAVQGRGGTGIMLSLSGMAVDERGVVRLGNPLGSSGILERRERAKLLRGEAIQARKKAENAQGERERAEGLAEEAQEALEAAWKAFREGEDAFRSASAEAQVQSDRRARLDRQQEELSRQIEGAKTARNRALDRARTAWEDHGLLLEEGDHVQREEEIAQKRKKEAQTSWEETGAEEARLSLELAKREGERDRFLERLRDLESSLEASRSRLSGLEEEESGLRLEESSGAELKEEGADATERLFGERDEAEADLRRKEDAAVRMAESLQEADRRVRAARTAEREAADRRHSQELVKQELVGRIRRIQDRLEAEWGRPLEVLLAQAEPVEGEPEDLREELEDIVVKLDKIGPVNQLAVEEHEEESARLKFLLEQRDDLNEARDDLRTAIRQINETAIQLFRNTFSKIQENFRNTFRRLFEGGEADLWLEDEDDPLESTIEIHASPRGKKTQRIDLLSGGERALTALSLLFGIYLVKPSPFCVLDEVDAPLDESNIYRFIRLLQEFKDQTQFVVITHNARTIEAADWIYGVTMEEPGVSRIVGVQLEDALEVSGSAA